ncbi:pyrazinamidase/nicotinamidase, partial [Pseudomonas syringae pv. theae ICMP 3923]
AGYLKERGIDTLFVVGLALDFCVAWSAQDARSAGFNTYVIEDACRAIDMNGSLDHAWKTLLEMGVERVQSADLLGQA